jgi:MFS family permease
VRGGTATALAGLAALAVGLGIGRFLYTPILPHMVEAGVLSAGEAGFVASANFAGYLAGALLAATPLVRRGPGLWLVGALLASSATTAGMALVVDPIAAALVRFVGGVCSAFVLVLASSAVLDRLAAMHRLGLSAVLFAGVGVGIAASAVLMTTLGAGGASWQVLWIAGGLTSLVLSSVAAPVLARPRPTAPVPGSARQGRAGGIGRIVTGYGLFGFGYVITATFLVALVRETGSASAEAAVWLIVGLTAIPSVAVWARVARSTGEARAFALACALEAVGVAATVLVPSAIGIAVGGALLGATFMGITAMGIAHTRRVGGDPRRIIALMTASFGIGQIVGPAFAGQLVEVSGSLVVPSLTAAAALIVASLLTVNLRDAPAPRDAAR